MYHRSAPILEQYARASVEVSPTRRISVFGLKIAVAAAYGALVVALPATSIAYLILPIIVMLMITLWMLPDRGTFPRQAIETLFPTFFVVSVIWPVYLAIALPGLPWATPTRVLLFTLIFIMLYSVSVSSILRRHLYLVASSSRAMWTLFLLWEVMQVVTLPLSATPGISLKEVFGVQCSIASLMFFGCLLFTRPGWATRIINLFIIMAIVTSLDGLLELHLGAPPWANYIPSFMRVDESLLANVLGSQARTADGLYRVRGPFPNSLIFAEFLALCMPFIVHAIFASRNVARRATMVLVFALVLTAIWVTQSRLGMVGVLVSLIGYPGLWAIRQWRSNKAGILGPTIVLGFPVIAALMLGVVFSSHTLTLKILGGGAQAASTQSRAIQREMAVPKILHNPIGYGLGRSGQTLGFVNPGGSLTIDSNFISTVLDLGVPGFIGFFGLCGFAAYNCARLYLRKADENSDVEFNLGGPMALCFIIFVAIKYVSTQDNNHWIIFLLFGMTLAFVARARGMIGADGLASSAAASLATRPEARIPAAASVTGTRLVG